MVNLNGQTAVIEATGLTDIHIPMLNTWGPSISVNEVLGPLSTENGLQRMTIEMQSGDVITLLAKELKIPSG